MGDFGVRTDPSTIRFERMLPGPIERVWAYLTEPEKRARWLAAGPMELIPGGAVELRFHNSRLSGRDEPVPERWRKEDRGTVCGRVLACDPPRRLSYSWGDAAEGASEVTFELTQKGNEVHLVLTHRRIGDGSMLLSVASGWHTHLEFLAEELSGIEHQPFWPMLTAREQDYAARLHVS